MSCTFLLLLLLVFVIRGSGFKRLSLLSSSHMERELWGQPGLNVNVLKNWIEIEGALVLLPPRSVRRKAIIHFVGGTLHAFVWYFVSLTFPLLGFLVGSISPLAYNDMLEYIAERGFLVVSTPIPPITKKHGDVARKVQDMFDAVKEVLRLETEKEGQGPLPMTIGLCHSLGGKLTALLSSSRSQPGHETILWYTM
jgi:Protein of unknown function (DUF1350)